MDILVLIFSIIGIMIGIYLMIKSNSLKDFYEKLEKGKVSEYKKIIGTVICDAYDVENSAEIPSRRPVTPIVEYIVDGEKYETMNRILQTGAELPVGTRMYVWYKKDDPKQAILGTELKSFSFEKLFGAFLICFGTMFLLGVI